MWTLIFSVWYSFASIPDGHWGYHETIEDLPSQAQCETLAKNKYQASEPYTGVYDIRDFPWGMKPRAMRIVNRKHICVQEMEYQICSRSKEPFLDCIEMLRSLGE